MARHLTDAEGIHQPPACVAARKFLKVLKAITDLGYIPQDEEFELKKRIKALREKWLDVFGDVVLPRREKAHTIIDLTESADESPQSAGQSANVISRPVLTRHRELRAQLASFIRNYSSPSISKPSSQAKALLIDQW